MANSVRLQDVADLAGVSIGTASQALNDRPNVAQETRARVIDAAQTLGYPIKRPMTPSKPGLEVVGMLMKHDFGFPTDVNPFYTHVQAGVESECRNANLSLMYANIEVDTSNHPIAWPSMLHEQRIDGLLLIGTFIEDTVGILRERFDMPIVLVDGYAPTMPFDSIVIDNATGARTAVEHLITLGHRHIGLIGSNPQSPPSVLERRQAFIETLRAHQLPGDYVVDSELTQESGYATARALLERSPEVTAIFASADIVAIGALNAARELGIEVPARLSVMGFDNIRMASVVTPRLTTIHVHKRWMGVLGVRQLLQRAAEPHLPKLTLQISTELIERDSVGPIETQQDGESEP